MIICVCNNVTEREVLGAIELGARTLDALHGVLGVSANCGACAESAMALLAKHAGDSDTKIMALQRPR